MTSYDTEPQREISFDKFMDAELLLKRRIVIDNADTPLRAQERVKRRSPGEVTVVR